MLPPERLDRFARHIVLPEVGGAGQAALAKAKVVLIGLGGIGSPALQYLAGAGVGSLVLVDDDTVDATNLQRQTIYREDGVGHSKAELAEVWVREFDCSLEVRWVRDRLTAGNAASIIDGADLVLDGCDNFATRLAVSDACVAAKVPLVSAAVGRFQGQVGAFAGHLPDQPCYRCYVGDAFDAVKGRVFPWWHVATYGCERGEERGSCRHDGLLRATGDACRAARTAGREPAGVDRPPADRAPGALAGRVRAAVDHRRRRTAPLRRS